MTDEELFEHAIELPGTTRVEYLREVCGADVPQLQRVLALLSSHSRSDSLLDTEAMSVDTQFDHGVPNEIGDFQIGRLLGRGGMGVVYEAKQKSLNRTVALKLLSSGLGLSSRAILRFRREAEAAGKLHHTNIVPIYTTGEDRGVHYYAMELIDGPSLDRVIAQQKLDPGSQDDQAISSDSTLQSGSSHFDNIASMFAEVADALDHAHEHGVIHRDIKPSNLLLGPDERLSINDFGLARMLEQPGMTMTGEFVGSPLYMSPEQIAAGRTPIDHRTDIYSLGATLYEMLTSQPPFPGDSRDQVLTGILHKEAQSTRKLNRKIPVDLDTIVMKAIDKDPDRRYQTAGKLAEDLRAFVNRHAISARRMGPAGKAVKFFRRNPLAALLFALMIVIAGGAMWIAYSNTLAHLQQLEQMKADVTDLAMSGKFPAARAKLSDAMEFGLSDGDQHLLEGQIRLFNGEDIAARAEFEQAAASMPNDTASASLLAISLFLSGDEDGYLTKLRAVSELPVSSYSDRLFKGFALHWFAPKPAIDLLEAADDESNGAHHAARLLLGEAKIVYAMSLKDRREGLIHGNEARSKLRSVKDYWQGTSNVDSQLLNANLTLALIHRELGNVNEEEDCLQEGNAIAAKIQQRMFEDESATLPVMNYHMIAETDERMIELVRQQIQLGRRLQSGTHGYFEIMMPSLFFGRDQAALAMEVYEQAPGQTRELTAYVPAFIAMDSPTAVRDAILSALREDLDNRMSDRHTGVYLNLDWVALRMLNADDERLQEVAKRIHLAYSTFFLGEDRDRGMLMADYMRGEADWNVVERDTCQERGIATYAYLSRAVNLLVEGKRSEAKRMLQASVDAGFYQYYAHKWSRAFLRRIDDDDWLPWLPNDGSLNAVVSDASERNPTDPGRQP